MTITAALVLFAVTWFMVFFCVLPLRFKSQADLGQVTPGTPASAPENPMVGKKAKITTVISAVIFAGLYFIITSGLITRHNMDVFHILN
jgi:predicted secreted protein